MITELVTATSLVLALAGFVGLVVVPLVFRYAGESGASAALATALVLELLALILGVWTLGSEASGALATVSVLAPAFVLGWCIIAYIAYRWRLSWLVRHAYPLLPEALELAAVGACAPNLIFGRDTIARNIEIGQPVQVPPPPPPPPGPPPPQTWVTFLAWAFACRPTDPNMQQLAVAVGGIFIGLSFSAQYAFAIPLVEIICLEEPAGRCLAFASTVGTTSMQRGPVAVNVRNTIQSQVNRITVITEMEASLRVRGGLPGPVSPLRVVRAMGTYIWRCERGEGV